MAPRMFAPRIATLVCLSISLSLLTTGCGKSATQEEGSKAEANGEQIEKPPAPPPLTQEQLAELYREAKARYEATTKLPDESFAELVADLQRVANEAEDAHLRANASLLLGSMHEERDDSRAAISYYRQAQELIPDDPGPYIVLALALSKAKKWDEAIAAQWKVVEMIPDDLVGWLLLGELHVKGGKLDEAAKVYGAYELRRKGLLDGLTLKQKGEYLESEDERAACIEALTPAVDNGTALALMYALDSDPSPKVRAQIAATMGAQRLVGYKEFLEKKQAAETDAEVKEAMAWALAEIERDPVETAPGPVPEELAEEVKAEVEAQAQEAAKQEAANGAGETSGEAGETGETGETGEKDETG
jgi:tetratricopeptide (TPR) repeat protein